MSLTNPFGIKEKEIKRIIKECCPDKSEFYSLDASQCFNTKSECIVPSELTATEANLCGMAFDYLARFFIARVINNKDNVIKTLKVDYVINRNFCCKLKIDKKSCKNQNIRKK